MTKYIVGNDKAQIRCPKCGKILGSWAGENTVRIDKVGLLVVNADSMPRVCGNCGHLLDMVKEKGEEHV